MSMYSFTHLQFYIHVTIKVEMRIGIQIETRQITLLIHLGRSMLIGPSAAAASVRVESRRAEVGARLVASRVLLNPAAVIHARSLARVAWVVIVRRPTGAVSLRRIAAAAAPISPAVS
jgi:subtilase family serine protease